MITASQAARPATTKTLTCLRREYADVGIGPSLYGLVNRTVVLVSRQYPAVVYSPDREHAWTPEGRASLAHAWVASRLLGPRRGLERLLDRATTATHLERLLQRSLRDHLRDALAPEGTRRMRARALAVLMASPRATNVQGDPRNDAALWSLDGAVGTQTSRHELDQLA